jgi:hypothetical protein
MPVVLQMANRTVRRKPDNHAGVDSIFIQVACAQQMVYGFRTAAGACPEIRRGSRMRILAGITDILISERKGFLNTTNV